MCSTSTSIPRILSLSRATLWTDLLSRLGNELDHPNPRAVFRGSLIDEKMFAIDVMEWGMADLNEQLRSEKDSSRGKEKG